MTHAQLLYLPLNNMQLKDTFWISLELALTIVNASC